MEESFCAEPSPIPHLCPTWARLWGLRNGSITTEPLDNWKERCQEPGPKAWIPHLSSPAFSRTK